jgi:hypothetical protein
MSPGRGSTQRQTDWLTVSRNVTLTLTLWLVGPCHSSGGYSMNWNSYVNSWSAIAFSVNKQNCHFVGSTALRPRHSSSGYSLASHSGGPGSSPGLIKWDLWWTMWRWGRFSPSTSVSPANLHSAKVSIIIITRSRYNRPFSGRRAEWTQLGLHPPLCELKKSKYIASESYFSWRTPHFESASLRIPFYP